MVFDVLERLLPKLKSFFNSKIGIKPTNRFSFYVAFAVKHHQQSPKLKF
jgi:hypothetical protein